MLASPLLLTLFFTQAAAAPPTPGETPVWAEEGDCPTWVFNLRHRPRITSPPAAIWRSPPGAVGSGCGDPVLVADRLLVGTNSDPDWKAKCAPSTAG